MPKRLQKELVVLFLQKYQQNKECFGHPNETMIKEVIKWISKCHFVI